VVPIPSPAKSPSGCRDAAGKKSGSSVVTRDLAAKPLPYLDAAFLGAVYTPEESRTAEQKAYSDLGFEIINEF